MVKTPKSQQKLEELYKLRLESQTGGGPKRVEAQHNKGKLTARERIDLLLDKGSFEELDAFVLPLNYDASDIQPGQLGDGVVTGYGQVNGRMTFVYSHDFTVSGGSLSEAVARKICKILDQSLKTGAPVVGLIDSGGAKIQEGIDSLAGYSSIFESNVRASGVVPQISAIMGPAAGGATYSPALTDFVFAVEGTGQLYITGPSVVKAVTGEDLTLEELGGANVHASQSGVVHFKSPSEPECLKDIRNLLSFLPSNNMEEADRHFSTGDYESSDEKLRSIVPDDPRIPYDIRNIVLSIIDERDFMEVHKDFARNIVVGFGKIGGESVGIVANQPQILGGALDIDASVKGARFIRFCDAFNIPILTLIDVPGFMPGKSQEYGGIIRHGAKLIYAYVEATVPKVSVLIRKAYGGAYIVMSSKNLRGDINLSWPSGEVAVMGAEAAVNLISKKAIEGSVSPEQTRQELITQYTSKFMNPYVAAGRGLIDDVIDPKDTRIKVVQALKMLGNKRETFPPKKHGNIPL